MERPPMEKALSTDVVLDIIMSYLKVRDLLSCRQVSKCWNKAASSLLRRRWTMIDISNAKTLMEIGKGLKQNPDFPFAALRFCEPWKMSAAGAMKFVKTHGGRFTGLDLDTSSALRLQDIAPFINHLPRLSILELRLSSKTPSRGKVLDPADSEIILDLSSVRTIRLSPSFPKQNADLVEWNQNFLCQVFKAASSSELRIKCLDTSYKILSALEMAGKLQAVSVMNSSTKKKQNDDVLRVDHWLSTQTPSLTKLDLKDGGCISREGLMTLLISSQKTLKYLHLDGISPSQLSSECPVLTNLTKLSLNIQKSYEYVFGGRKGHKFPALKELKLCVPKTDELFSILRPSISKMSDGLFIVPSLKRIDLDCCVNRTGIEDLSRSFPNVMEIRLKQYDSEGWSYNDRTEIWSVRAFKFLEKLVIRDYIARPLNLNYQKYKDYVNIDSFLTGIPIGICENLRKHNQPILTDPPYHQMLRDSPSLLQLKNLKELVVCVKLEGGLKKFPEEPPFISMVSVWYALQMMPNLEAKFVYEYNSPSLDFKEKHRNKTVAILKDAFKLVQPFVKLEPWFY